MQGQMGASGGGWASPGPGGNSGIPGYGSGGQGYDNRYGTVEYGYNKGQDGVIIIEY